MSAHPTLLEMSFAIEPDEVAEAGASFLQKLPTDEYPDLAEHVMQHLEGPGHVDAGDFEFALDLILDGIERIMDRAYCRRRPDQRSRLSRTARNKRPSPPR